MRRHEQPCAAGFAVRLVMTLREAAQLSRQEEGDRRAGGACAMTTSRQRCGGAEQVLATICRLQSPSPLTGGTKFRGCHRAVRRMALCSRTRAHLINNGAARPMARTYLVFGDIEGKLDVLRVGCTKCPRATPRCADFSATDRAMLCVKARCVLAEVRWRWTLKVL
jgi:hypothetical protein